MRGTVYTQEYLHAVLRATRAQLPFLLICAINSVGNVVSGRSLLVKTALRYGR